MNVCVEDYAQGKSYSFDADTLSPEKQIYAKLFPNPNDGESVMLAYDFLSDEPVNIQIFEVIGKKLLSFPIKYIDFVSYGAPERNFSYRVRSLLNFI